MSQQLSAPASSSRRLDGPLSGVIPVKHLACPRAIVFVGNDGDDGYCAAWGVPQGDPSFIFIHLFPSSGLGMTLFVVMDVSQVGMLQIREVKNLG